MNLQGTQGPSGAVRPVQPSRREPTSRAGSNVDICWTPKRDQISKITIQLTTKTFQRQQVQLSQLERRASSSDPNYPRGAWAGPQGLSRGKGWTRTAESNNRAWTAGWCKGGLVEEGWLDGDKMVRIQFLGVWISCDPYCWFGTNKCTVLSFISIERHDKNKLICIWPMVQHDWGMHA